VPKGNIHHICRGEVIEKQFFVLKSQARVARTEYIAPIGSGFGIYRGSKERFVHVVRTL
jgi:hypothetical protein